MAKASPTTYNIRYIGEDPLTQEVPVEGKDNQFEVQRVYPTKMALVLYAPMPKSWDGLNAAHKRAITLTPMLIRINKKAVDKLKLGIGDDVTLEFKATLGITASPDERSRKRPLEVVGITKLAKVTTSAVAPSSGTEDVEALPW